MCVLPLARENFIADDIDAEVIHFYLTLDAIASAYLLQSTAGGFPRDWSCCSKRNIKKIKEFPVGLKVKVPSYISKDELERASPQSKIFLSVSEFSVLTNCLLDIPFSH